MEGDPIHLYKVIRDVTCLIRLDGTAHKIFLVRGDIVQINVADPDDYPRLDTLLHAKVLTGRSRDQVFLPHVMDLGSKFVPLGPLEYLAWAAGES